MSPFTSTTFAFLFTDIEGSTSLWEHLPDVMPRALEWHDALVRGAVEGHGGKVFKTVGDGFCCVFGDAKAAAEAAAAAQRAVQAEPWQALDERLGPVRVRMAIHAGPAIERGGDYFGPTLNQTARLLSAANGGQILSSLVAHQMVRGRLNSNLTLVDRGHHTLRDLRFSEHIFELVVAGLQRDQRPLRVAEDSPHDNPLVVAPGEDRQGSGEGGDLQTLMAQLLRNIRTPGGTTRLSQAETMRLAHHVPEHLTAYRLSRLAEWSLPQYQLDRRFVSLSLLVDLGEEAHGMRWLAEPTRFDDLAAILDATHHPALVILGPPGSGKSTLLRHLEQSVTVRALRDETDVVTWYVPLNHFHLSGEAPEPEAIERWFQSRWRDRFPSLPPLGEIRRQGRLLLLLDGLNEIPHADSAEYRRIVIAWRQFVHLVLGGHPGNRAVFSCRSLDYSAPLSSPTLRVPQVVIQPLDTGRIQDFLKRYSPEYAAQLWQVLRSTPQIETLYTPYLLRMLVDQVEQTGQAPRGRAALFTGFVRLALEREITLVNTVLGPNDLLTERDHRQIVQGGPWESPFALPERGHLFGTLSRLAFELHSRTSEAEGAQVVIDYTAACEQLGSPDCTQVLDAAEALGLIAELTANDEVAFVHQLMQEYLAARHVARTAEVPSARVEWRADAVAVPLRQSVAELAPADPLPLLPGSRWDEVLVMACSMAADPDAFVLALLDDNAPLAGRCVATGEADLSPATLKRVAARLVERRADPTADLRARIEATLRLGEVGDPAFEPRMGPHGRYLVPPMVPLPAGNYTIGHDGALEGAALPRQVVSLSEFALGRFPVTNAEFECFIDSGGYEDDIWWTTDGAKAWHRGEGTGEPARQREWRFFHWFNDSPDILSEYYARGFVTQPFYDRWLRWSKLDSTAFRTEVEAQFPDLPVRLPYRWDDVGFNAALQPIVGVCWYEAEAFCAWLSAQSGQRFRLPSEQEWEAAARGIEGRRFAWGEDFDIERCNSVEAHIRRTTPVGVFPAGQSPEGIDDLTGNVFEWTQTLDRALPVTDASGTRIAEHASGQTLPDPTRAVYRGASWGSDIHGLEAWHRNSEPVASRGDNSSLRLALDLLPLDGR